MWMLSTSLALYPGQQVPKQSPLSIHINEKQQFKIKQAKYLALFDTLFIQVLK